MMYVNYYSTFAINVEEISRFFYIFSIKKLFSSIFFDKSIIYHGDFKRNIENNFSISYNKDSVTAAVRQGTVMKNRSVL